ncbi:hypothetical protein AB0G74_05510 [Streptomyces sp. NPDC020875]|uniref:hypothetical protein n=1 Tax=Streptomyces sp. NPDC020875 TaxID=3154898 RepID=UPI0033D65C61
MDLHDRITAYARESAAQKPYRSPGKTQRQQLAQGVGHLLDGDFGKAERVLGDIGLRVTRLTDAATGKRYDEVAAREPGTKDRWGRLYLHADTGIRWSVQVPHPVADRHTESLGAKLLEGTPGGALVVAGAHRDAGRGDSADVAHREDSAFHAIVAALQKRGIPGAQLHGFAAKPDRPYDAVLSTGAARIAPGEVTALADRMENRGLRVCRGWADRCPLEGITNVQGESAERRGVTFLHVELAPGLRRDGTRAAAETRSDLSRLLEAWSATGR